jgi:hypothetical protein
MILDLAYVVNFCIPLIYIFVLVNDSEAGLMLFKVDTVVLCLDVIILFWILLSWLKLVRN